jgi:hypothetical protein
MKESHFSEAIKKTNPFMEPDDFLSFSQAAATGPCPASDEL